ncbi:ThiF family adenylyltransferase (plasmid) [Streptomyces sp. L7]|uniref:hypothetical protein n=1 Tax=Streptomyces sp. L7 TaxID=3423954 RepID=UPI00389B2AD6
MNITLRLPMPVHDELLAMATGPVESGAVLIAHLVPGRDDSMILLGAQLIPVPEGAYDIRSDRSLQVTSDGYVHALKVARDRGGVALWVHSHPGEGALPMRASMTEWSILSWPTFSPTEPNRVSTDISWSAMRAVR